MTITRGGKTLTARYYGRKKILVVYRGLKTVWQAIASCFGAGFWRNGHPWKNEEGWKNN